MGGGSRYSLWSNRHPSINIGRGVLETDGDGVVVLVGFSNVSVDINDDSDNELSWRVPDCVGDICDTACCETIRRDEKRLGFDARAELLCDAASPVVDDTKRY